MTDRSYNPIALAIAFDFLGSFTRDFSNKLIKHHPLTKTASTPTPLLTNLGAFTSGFRTGCNCSNLAFRITQPYFFYLLFFSILLFSFLSWFILNLGSNGKTLIARDGRTDPREREWRDLVPFDICRPCVFVCACVHNETQNAGKYQNLFF